MQHSTDLAADIESLHIDRSPALPLASLGARLGGHVFDTLSFYASAFAAVRVLGPFRELGPWGWPFVLAVPMLNFVLCLVWGQTLGKMIAGTRVVTMHDARVAWWQLLLRYPAWGLGVLDLAFIFDASRRPLHDKLAGTRVVTAASSAHLYSG
ncbi:MAG: RDD family protein [Polyangiales bacterium]